MFDYLKMSLEDWLAEAGAHLSDEDAKGVHEDVEILGRSGITTRSQLVDAVADSGQSLSARLTACHLAGWLRETGATKALEQALEQGDDEGLVWTAAKALIQIGAHGSAPTLLRVLERGNSSQQAAAAYALGWLGPPNVIPALRGAASNPQLAVAVRGHAVEALGVMQARKAVPDLIALLSDEAPEIRYWAAYSLGEIGDPESIPHLERMAAHDLAVLGPPYNKSLREEALDALAAIHEREQNDNQT